MVRVLFVCHGNICRSPMAACVMGHMAKERGMEDAIEINSAATSAEELGNPIYPPAKQALMAHGITPDGHRSTRLTAEDYGRYDYLVGMDGRNISNMRRILGGDPENKVRRLLDYTARPGDVADPWYTGDFEATYRDVAEGCKALLDKLGF